MDASNHLLMLWFSIMYFLDFIMYSAKNQLYFVEEHCSNYCNLQEESSFFDRKKFGFSCENVQKYFLGGHSFLFSIDIPKNNL